MTSAKDLFGREMDSVNNMIGMAISEIYRSYGDVTQVRRKALHKFGRLENAGTSEAVIWPVSGQSPVRSLTNSIDTISSSSASDTQVIRVEGSTIDGNDLYFSVQFVTLNGQNKVTLSKALNSVTRVRNDASATETVGDVYVYEDTAISAGVPVDSSKIGNVMTASDQTSLLAGTTIATPNYFIMTEMYASIGEKTSAVANIKLRSSAPNVAEHTLETHSASNSGRLSESMVPHRIITPGSYITMTSVASASNVDVLAGFRGFFADIV